MADDIKQRIQDDVKSAMRARDKARLGVLRQVTAAIKQREIDERIELDDGAVSTVLDKMLKQRRDSLSQFEQAGRDDLVAQEAFEIEVIGPYMPRALDPQEVEQLITQAIAESGAEAMQDMGRVMNLIKDRAQGRVDLKTVSAAIKTRLSGV